MNKSNDIKKAVTEFPVHPLIETRWSPRAYDSRPVESDKLQRIFEAARWAPSSSNLQPWYFLVGFKGDDVYAKIFGTLVEFNQLWAGNAPILVVAITKTTNTRGEPNAYNAYDLGQAMAMLSIQSTYEGVFVHQMGGFNATEAERILDIPEEYKVLTVFTLGYISDKTELHPNLQKAEVSPRTRRPVGESVFTGSFGQKAIFL